jgi:ATP-binding cassette subfamily F protein 3
MVKTGQYWNILAGGTMALLSVRNISKAYADKSILEGASLQVNPGEKVGLVGANGCGKTTLLKIIIGAEEADAGEVFTSRGVSMGYLSQKPGFLPEAELQEIFRGALAEIYSIKEEMTHLEEKMASFDSGEKNKVLTSLMERYGELAHQFEENEGYMLENRLQMIAQGLGFREADLERSIETFSGGEKTRAQLASLLLSEPDLLLLDEPTNSLDAESIEWLENFLVSWRGALLVVSHDRFFLDRIVGRIIALENKKLLSYQGNFSNFLHQREIITKTLHKAYKKQEITIKKHQDFIRNAAADRRTKRQARSREKLLEKLDLIKKPEKTPSWKARFDFAGREGRSVVVFERVSKYYGSFPVFKNASFEIKGGDRVAVLGPNGAGKTTLLRVITGEETIESGVVKIGSGSKMAYFDQEQKTLMGELTVLENIMDVSGMLEAEARHFLGNYLFRGDDVFKLVKSLSGGEKSRLALARMALEESNFLIMDEPTNHLDIWGISELEAALTSYPGTLLIVSHDRYFVSRTATKILEINNRRVKLYNGTYAEYREMQLREKEGKEQGTGPLHNVASIREQSRIKKEKEEARRKEIMAVRRKRRQLHQTITGIEEKIVCHEKKISHLEKQLASPGIYDDFAKARPFLAELTVIQDEVRSLYEKWEKLGLLLDEFPQQE